VLPLVALDRPDIEAFTLPGLDGLIAAGHDC
jgi:hypothetical protein